MAEDKVLVDQQVISDIRGAFDAFEECWDDDSDIDDQGIALETLQQVIDRLPAPAMRREGFRAGDLVRLKEDFVLSTGSTVVVAGTYGIVDYFHPEEEGLRIGVRWLRPEGTLMYGEGYEVYRSDIELITKYEDLGVDRSVA
jgi:hypothetical protein